MHVFSRDAYQMIARVVDPAGPTTVIDVGGNVGQSVRRITEVFPKAVVHSFEPSPEPFKELERVCRTVPAATPWPLAVGAASGHVEFNLMGDSQMSSVLAPSTFGREYYTGDIVPRRSVKVPMVSLDDWAGQNRIGEVQILKVDVQGIELDVLRGAERLIRSGGVRAIKCEAPLFAEYDGASTLFEIEPFMRSVGMKLHQIHEVWSRGDDQQTCYVDALWLRSDVLAWLKEEPEWGYRVDWRRRMSEAIRRCESDGDSRIGLFGAGGHTKACESVLRRHPSVCAVIDDNPAVAGSSIAGIPVVSASAAAALGLQSVILSSNSQEHRLWKNAEGLRAAGVRVIPLYTSFPAQAAVAA